VRLDMKSFEEGSGRPSLSLRRSEVSLRPALKSLRGEGKEMRADGSKDRRLFTEKLSAYAAFSTTACLGLKRTTLISFPESSTNRT